MAGLTHPAQFCGISTKTLGDRVVRTELGSSLGRHSQEVAGLTCQELQASGSSICRALSYSLLSPRHSQVGGGSGDTIGGGS